MKHVRKNYLFLWLLLFSISCSYFKRDAAINYNNSIIDVQSVILHRMDAFSESFGSSDSELIAIKLEALSTTIDSSITAVQAMKGFEGNNDLKNAAIQLFEFYKATASNDYLELIQIFKKSEFTQADKNKVDEINSRIAKGEAPLDEALRKAQEGLSVKYNFKMDGPQKTE